MFSTSAIFLSASQQKWFTEGAAILTYHKIAAPPQETRDPFLYHSPTRFAEHLEALERAEFTTASLDEVVTQEKITGNRIVITFDDGCENVFQNALETLARHRFTAIQFLVSDFLGKRNEWDISKGDSAAQLMDEMQIKEWIAAGNQIGSHSATHPNLRRLSREQVREEVFSSKKKLEDKFGIPVRHFCYPYGGWNPAVRELVQEAGYASACSVEFGINTVPMDRFALRRVTPLSASEWIAKSAHRLRRKLLRA